MRQFSGRFYAALAVAAVALAAGGLTACSSAPSTQSGGAGKVLTIWTWRPEDVPGLRAVGNLFTKETGYRVEIQTSIDDASYGTKIEAAARTGSLPDILTLNYGNIGDGLWAPASAGELVNMTPDITKSWQKEFSPLPWQSAELTKAVIQAAGTGTGSISNLKPGQIWGVPIMQGNAGIIFARKSVLAKAGLSTTKPPATWQQLISEIQATRKAVGPQGGIVTGLQIPETALWAFQPLSWAYLGTKDYVNRSGPHPASNNTWTSPASVGTFNLWNKLSPLWIPGVLSLGITQADQSFIDGKAAWDLGGTFTLGGLINGGVPASDILALPVPAAAGGKISKIVLPGTRLVDISITKHAQYPAAALQYIKLITSPAGAVAFAKGAGTLPATQLTNAEVASLPPAVSAMYNAVTGQAGVGYNPSTFGYEDPPTAVPPVVTGSTDLTALVNGSKTPAEVAAEWQQAWTAGWQSVGK